MNWLFPGHGGSQNRRLVRVAFENSCLPPWREELRQTGFVPFFPLQH